MNILDENGESYFVTAFDHSTQEQGTATSKDAFTGGDINASLTQEVVELRKEVIGHGTDQLLYLAGKDGGLVSDDLVDIAVFQDPGIERITLACDTVVEGNDTLLEALYHRQIRMAAAQLQDIDGKAANVQILSPFRKRGAVASNALNETIRELVNPPNNLKKEMKCGSRVFRVGDRIMQTVNRINVSNGDVGIISDMEKEDDETIVCVKLLDGRELRYTQEMLEDLEFSYCTTIHKSQGQEYPVIIVPLLKEHYIMLRRNLLYTAVTRAKAKVILIGQKQAVFIAIHKCDVGQRNTVLADRIVAYYNRELSNQVT